jgi:hypothetical protein
MTADGIGAYKAWRGVTDVLVWGAGQFGRWGRIDQRSGAIAAEAGWQPGGGVAEKIKPWFRAGYFRIVAWAVSYEIIYDTR